MEHAEKRALARIVAMVWAELGPDAGEIDIVDAVSLVWEQLRHDRRLPAGLLATIRDHNHCQNDVARAVVRATLENLGVSERAPRWKLHMRAQMRGRIR